MSFGLMDEDDNVLSKSARVDNDKSLGYPLPKMFK